MLTKTDKTRLIKVCKVLFPKFKHVSVDRIRGIVSFCRIKTPIIRWFIPKWKISITELIEFRIPKQLADFKYGNTTMINQVQEDLVRCDMDKRNKIDYFLEEITKIKCADVYKQLNVPPDFVTITPSTELSLEDEVFYAMMEYQREKAETKPIRRKSYWVSTESLFYISLILIVLYSCIRNFIS